MDKSNLPNLFKSSMLFLNIEIKSLLSLSPILPASMQIVSINSA